jgi:hypothetical protein
MSMPAAWGWVKVRGEALLLPTVLCLRCVMACSIIELWNVTPGWGTSS